MARITRTLTALAVAVLLLAATADAALTTSACLVQKRKAWITFRKCQGSEQVKLLKGKPADLANCQTKFQDALAKITTKATKAAIACRYGANGDGTVTDYDTGLQWETKNGEVGGVCLIFVDHPNHCVNSTYTLVDAQSFVGSLNGSSANGLILTNPFAGSADWRLPTVTELRTILDMTALGCDSGSPCIDPIFGPTVPTVAGGYWSATTVAGYPAFAWGVFFSDGYVGYDSKDGLYYVRAVRAGL